MACRLHIKICEAKKVLKMDLGGKSDPYVTLRLKSQDKKDVQKTQVISNTTDPIWNQEFDIIVEDPNDILLINMYDEDYRDDEKMMDELQYPVNTWPIGGPVDRKELDIKLKKKKAGKFIFEAQSFPYKKKCRIHIHAYEAQNVLKMDIGGKSDPYLRFGIKGKKDTRVKTQVIQNTRNPIWNQELDVISNDVENDVLEVDMFDEDIRNDEKMMDKIEIPLRDHPIGTRYVFNNSIKLKKKSAGSLHFELQFCKIESSSLDTSSSSSEVEEEEESNAENKNIQVSKNTVKLLTSSILQVPFNQYENDFAFVVNNQKYKTNKIVSDLISPKISNLHQIDPTINEFHISTRKKGDFKNILDLVSFEQKEIDDDEIEFVAEIFEKLGIEHSSVKSKSSVLKIENIIDLIEIHERSPFFYSSDLSKEIDFLSSHFHELNEEQNLNKLSMTTIEKVVSNRNLQLKSEDQLLKFINKLYSENDEFYELYEFVLFENVESETIDEFLSVFNFNDLTAGLWISISKRLHKEVEKDYNINESRYRRKILFSSQNNNLNGIFNFLQKSSNIENEVKVTASSYAGGNLQKILLSENANNDFYTNNENNPSICFEFKKYRIMPKSYTIKSSNNYQGGHHPKSWIIEGSVDNSNWIKIDEQKDCSELNGPKYSHNFSIKKKYDLEFKFIRITHTGNCWDNYNNILGISSIEFYGDLISN